MQMEGFSGRKEKRNRSVTGHDAMKVGQVASERQESPGE